MIALGRICIDECLYSPFYLFFYSYCDLRDIHSFPTRRSSDLRPQGEHPFEQTPHHHRPAVALQFENVLASEGRGRSEEHTSELQSRGQLVCRLLLEKKKENQ